MSAVISTATGGKKSADVLPNQVRSFDHQTSCSAACLNYGDSIALDNTSLDQSTALITSWVSDSIVCVRASLASHLFPPAVRPFASAKA